MKIMNRVITTISVFAAIPFTSSVEASPRLEKGLDQTVYLSVDGMC